MPISIKSSLVSFAFRLFFAPFLVGGIFLAAYWVKLIAGLGAGETQESGSFVHIIGFLLLMPIGVYLGALLGYSVLMASAWLFVSRLQFDRIVSILPPQPQPRSKILLVPISLIGSFFYSRLR